MSQWKIDLIDRQTPTIWPHIDVDDGWSPLVEFLYDEVSRVDCAHVAQVKEKFAGLRFYIEHDIDCRDALCGIDDLLNTIATVERLSHHICEKCGAHGYMRSGSWLRTLCDDCHDKNGGDK